MNHRRKVGGEKITSSPSGAKLDAWIAFNGDGNWGGPGEQIADSVAVVNGNNTITFDVPSGAADGTTFARFRLSTAGNLGPQGLAADGEVEDYAVSIIPPGSTSGLFGAQNAVIELPVRLACLPRTWTGTATWTCSTRRSVQARWGG